ncbi:hypothetical protein HK099_003971 [Clydaea vesicula]|uniref:L domain-like protein n=1 Tax=Clydaea vesicula TaxID=447962 RepID=A0AAD5UAT5_9FUNG|nr:hypothetical protein HK099_003971 [Clydaea vesicula]
MKVLGSNLSTFLLVLHVFAAVNITEINQQSHDCMVIYKWIPQIYPNNVADCCAITADSKDSTLVHITCDANKRVTKINIGKKYNPALTQIRGNWKSEASGILNAVLPPFLGLLTELTTFYVTDAFLYGQIPMEIGNLTKLQYFSVGYNSLTGEVPKNLFSNMKSLIALDISHNKLSGNIPNSFVGLPSLVSVQIGSNQFSGPLPDYSKLANVGLGPKYDIENGGGFLPICDFRNLGPTACVEFASDLTNKLPSSCILSTPPPKVCTPEQISPVETTKSIETPIFATTNPTPSPQGISDSLKIAIVAISIILFFTLAYFVSFRIIKRKNKVENERFQRERQIVVK